MPCSTLTWPVDIAEEDLLCRLLDLNAERASEAVRELGSLPQSSDRVKAPLGSVAIGLGQRQVSS